MRTRAAVIREASRKGSPGSYEVIDVEIDEPRQGEVTVKLAATGLCHSDDHVATGDMPVPTYPYIGGHEGAGVVEKVGPNTVGFEVGDHVVFSFIPFCGRCRWCARGMQNLCDLGATLGTGTRPEDSGSYRIHLPDGSNVGQACGIGAFAEHSTVSTSSVVKIDEDLPLDKMCLLGCCVGTGWGSAVNSASVEPGDTVIVMGIGGIGINAVQGAASIGAANIVAVDPVPFKLDVAKRLGATHVFSTIQEADSFAKSVTNGQGADAAIVAVGVVDPEHVAQAFAAIRKAGTVVVTGLGNVRDKVIPVSLFELTLFQKRIQGSLFGQMSPSWDIPRQVEMYRSGALKLDELITTTYTLDEIAQGYRDMHAGRNIRGVITFT
jgi:NDMA-dependent alcohol dehydrogenase